MNEEYLWSKTGEDREIERLETALKAFRYHETQAPPLPAKVLPFKKEPSRRLFKFKFPAIAAAACVALFAVISPLLFRFSSEQSELKHSTAQSIESPVDYLIVQPEKIEKPVEGITKEPQKRHLEIAKIAPPKWTKKTTETLPGEPVKLRPKPAKTKIIIPSAKPEIRLTSEEKYAYDQLMTALSVTSSKLKMVKDKVEGADEKTVQTKELR